MASKKKVDLPAKQLEWYDRLIENHPEITRKGATMPYTSHNGHMFSFLDKTGAMSLRLGSEDRELFLKKYETQLSVQHGRIMKEYVLVPDDLLANTAKISFYLRQSYDFVKSLKPKPTKRKK